MQLSLSYGMARRQPSRTDRPGGIQFTRNLLLCRSSMPWLAVQPLAAIEMTYNYAAAAAFLI